MSDAGASHDWDAGRYDQISDPQARWGNAVATRLELGGDECVLDAGCGTGRFSEQLLERLADGKLIALDASPAMLEVARTRLSKYGSRVSYVNLDLSELSPDRLGERVDCIFSTATFHWVPDHDRLFSNLFSVLKPQGRLVAQCGGYNNINSVINAVRQLGYERAGTWVYATAEETRERLERAGFTQITTWLHEEPTPFDSLETLAQFLATVCLREHLETVPQSERASFIEQVAKSLPARTIDYVRLNIDASVPG